MEIKNLEYRLEPETTLFKEEADAIVAVVLDAIKMDKDKHNGTFALYGGKKGENTKPIILFDLEDGSSDSSLSEHNSRKYAEHVLEEIGKRYPSGCTVENYTGKDFYSPVILRLETTWGQFLAAFFSIDRDYYVYYAIAEALACMGKEDETMVANIDEMFSYESEDETGIYYLKAYIDDLFERTKLPEIKAWKEWHDKEEDNLVLFFED